MSEEIEASLDGIRKLLAAGSAAEAEAAARRHLQSFPANFRLQ